MTLLSAYMRGADRLRNRVYSPSSTLLPRRMFICTLAIELRRLFSRCGDASSTPVPPYPFLLPLDVLGRLILPVGGRSTLVSMGIFFSPFCQIPDLEFPLPFFFPVMTSSALSRRLPGISSHPCKRGLPWTPHHDPEYFCSATTKIATDPFEPLMLSDLYPCSLLSWFPFFR